MAQGTFKARRPKPAALAYNQGDGLFRFEVIKRANPELAAEAGKDPETVLVTLRENKLDGKIAAVACDEHDLTIMIQKLFECLINLQARR